MLEHVDFILVTGVLLFNENFFKVNLYHWLTPVNLYYRYNYDYIMTVVIDMIIPATAAAADNVSVFKFARWRRQGVVLDEVLAQYKSVGAELNVLPYCTQFIPMEVITEPRHQSICYHPSLLPLHRGASAINWSAAAYCF